MALLRGAPRLNLRLCGRVLKQPCPPVGGRSVSDKVLPRAEPSCGSDPVSDHFLYTPEHLALKASLRKVRGCAANCARSGVTGTGHGLLPFNALVSPATNKANPMPLFIRFYCYVDASRCGNPKVVGSNPGPRYLSCVLEQNTDL